MEAEQQHIDRLLERYLALLDEYAALRARLSGLQAAAQMGIARANFGAERGLRYGRDQYDGRMRAGRVLRLREGKGEGEGSVVFEVVVRDDDDEDGDEDGGETPRREEASTAQDQDATAQEEEQKKEDAKEEEEAKGKKKPSKNPLHWFGLLAPPPLRAAQADAVRAVEEVIPRLATVNAAMLGVEIEVRRARKRRAKAAQAAQAAAEREARGDEEDGVPTGDGVLAEGIEASS